MSLLAEFDIVHLGLPSPVGLAIVALLGYIVGRLRKQMPITSEPQARREIKRAQAVAKSLEAIAGDIRKDLARHRASLDRFKTRVSSLSNEHSEASWKELCSEAEEILGPTMHLATQIAHAYDQIRQQTNHLLTFSDVRTDPLTGVCNRRAMDDALASLVAMKNRYNMGFSLAMFDVDHFKQVNDRQGHLAGDGVLKAVAKLIEETARETDIVTRYGGEEFVVIMPQTELRGACVFVERMRQKIEKLLSVTVSGGATAAIGDGETSDAILVRADAAMYAAKQAGRNCTFFHDGLKVVPNGDRSQRISDAHDAAVSAVELDPAGTAAALLDIAALHETLSDLPTLQLPDESAEELSPVATAKV
ncbi:MAG: GGDEF domain-containing protein [Planctomycetia bacterium]|nr:GGDEF domain-containing protein [Planctomycetia bacterium]